MRTYVKFNEESFQHFLIATRTPIVYDVSFASLLHSTFLWLVPLASYIMALALPGRHQQSL